MEYTHDCANCEFVETVTVETSTYDVWRHGDEYLFRYGDEDHQYACVVPADWKWPPFARDPHGNQHFLPFRYLAQYYEDTRHK